MVVAVVVVVVGAAVVGRAVVVVMDAEVVRPTTAVDVVVGLTLVAVKGAVVAVVAGGRVIGVCGRVGSVTTSNG